MSDDDQEAYAIRRVKCVQCDRFSAAEIYSGTPGVADGVIGNACDCRSDKEGDESWEEFCLVASDIADGDDGKVILAELLEKGNWAREWKH